MRINPIQKNSIPIENKAQTIPWSEFNTCKCSKKSTVSISIIISNGKETRRSTKPKAEIFL
jgi:hypothetical protein